MVRCKLLGTLRWELRWPRVWQRRRGLDNVGQRLFAVGREKKRGGNDFGDLLLRIERDAEWEAPISIADLSARLFKYQLINALNQQRRSRP